MGRNEIRLRRQKISSGRIAQHRNYGELMATHERDKRIKRITRVFIYFLIVAVLLFFFFMVRRWELKRSGDVKKVTTSHIQHDAASFTLQATSLQPEA